MIVFGTNDNTFRKRLFREPDLTLSRGISARHAPEETRKHAHEIFQAQSAADLHKISKLRNSRHQVPPKNN